MAELLTGETALFVGFIIGLAAGLFAFRMLWLDGHRKHLETIMAEQPIRKDDEQG